MIIFPKNKLREFSCIFLFIAIGLTAFSSPNVIVILADDMGYGDLSCYGAEKIKTPHIDQLAADGIRFTDAHSSSAVCTPSRYSLLTGRYAWRTRLKRGVLGGFDPALIDAGEPTLATLFRKAGYKTACIGKWHLGMGWPVKNGSAPVEFGQNVDYTKPLTDTPIDHGFDYFFGISASLDFPPYAFIENRHVVGHVAQPKKVRYDSQRPGLQADDWNDLEVDTTFVHKAVDYIHQRAEAGEKFFIYLALPAPHRPCCPPECVAGKSDAGRRGDMVMLVDWGVGKIVESLKKEGLLDDSMIVLTSDNGGRPGDGLNPMELDFYQGTTQLPVRGKADLQGHGPEKWVTYGHRANGQLRGYKTDIYEGGHRVPMIVYAPSLIPSPAVCEQAVGLTDWYATFGELLKDPSTKGGQDSISLAAIFKGGASPRECVVHHSAKGMFAIRQGKWKYVDGAGSGGVTEGGLGNEQTGQLFDLSTDPLETRNLVDAHPEIAQQLKDRLKEIEQ